MIVLSGSSLLIRIWIILFWQLNRFGKLTHLAAQMYLGRQYREPLLCYRGYNV